MKFSLRRDLPALAIVAAMGAASAWAWSRVPDRVPVHWGISGEPDRWGGRAEGLLVLPAVALAVWVLMVVVPRFDPGRANYATFAGVYATLRTAIVGFMAILHGVAIAAALGAPVNMGHIAAPVLGILFVVLGGVMGKIRPNWFVGIRTPWTLSSKRAWTRTHRAGGWAFVALGVATLLAGLVSPAAGYGVMLVGSLALVAFTFVYSWTQWKADPDRTTPGGTTPAP